MTISTILITGANRGIGLEFTRQYSADGWQVLACCRNPEGAKDLQLLAAGSSQITIFPLDVTDYDQLATLSSRLQDQSIDILLSNAGIEIVGEAIGADLAADDEEPTCDERFTRHPGVRVEPEGVVEYGV
jgi:NAD(P)-dependent dehydrogenase (short-subunit alcohol dehydrogenase family)